MDGFAEANLLLSNALEQLDDIIKNGNGRPASVISDPTPALQNGCAKKIIKNNGVLRRNSNMKDRDDDIDNGNADDERSTKELANRNWMTSEWRTRRELNSDESSGVESPPSDLPTSSSSLFNPPKIYQEFVKAIEDHLITERPDLETRLKIMQWVAGRTEGCTKKTFEQCGSLPDFLYLPSLWPTAHAVLNISVDSAAPPSAQKFRVIDPGGWSGNISSGQSHPQLAHHLDSYINDVMYSNRDYVDYTASDDHISSLTVSSHNSQCDFRSSGSGNIFKEPVRSTPVSSSRPTLPYVTHYSDSGFGSALSAGSSCSYLPPPPPYRLRTKQHKIHRSLSDSKYSSCLVTATPLMSSPLNMQQRDTRGGSWNSLSPSPSMSTVSCPEYPELQEKLHRLAMARDSLQLQVSVLSEQVGAQKEKIRDLEALLALKRNNLTSTEELLQDKYHRIDDCTELESKKMDLLAEVSSLKLKFATLEREKNETEKKLRLSQNEMDHVNQSMHGMVVQQQLHHGNGHPPYMAPLREHVGEKQGSNWIYDRRYSDEEMAQLRTAVQRLMVDNEQKSLQICSLRNQLDEHMRSRSREDDYFQAHRWNEQPQFDVNAQIRRLLLDEPVEAMPHSTSFPVSLSSTSTNKNPRSAVQSSSSFTSSLSAASPQHSWSQSGTPRHLHAINANPRAEMLSYRSPSSPAARQLAAELDELRRMGADINSSQSYSTASLPRGMGKASSTLTLPAKKLSVASGASAGELRTAASVCGATPRRGYRAQMNRWISEKLGRKKRAISAPNLVESDDEVARGRNSTLNSQSSSQSNLKNFKRDRTRSSLRNIFQKLTRSTSQDQSNGLAFRRGSAARSTSSARLGVSGPLSGAIAMRPPLSQFVDWRSDQLAEWIAEVGFPQYSPEVGKHVRSGRHLLNMTPGEVESTLGMKNALHRKRLSLLLQRIEDDIVEPSSKWDVHQTLKWLEEIGLPQYKDTFAENVVDGSLLLALTAGDAVDMRITNAHHYATLARSIQFLKLTEFRFNSLEKRFDPGTVNRYPCPDVVVRWSHSATCEWLRKIDLAEFTPNLLCAGVPGSLMVYEPTFTAESLAEILQMPPHKTLLRRHLTSHFNQLLGQKIIAEKREFLSKGSFPQVSPASRVKVVRKGFSLTRKKAKNEICLEPDELLCPVTLNQKYPLANGDTSSMESSHV
ncbi:unnamed protein product [Caenorhabditis auriculariae]|uniref:SAM domain-containing protein n=1 Tax=Caenorhabditis auriculariae TaxID=2777116 RepID=A0A8S1GQE4_9PELO|nr:unnamed protein product [Caenorhabditis auriculariae]